jgi:pentatricopeptide repeat protein
VVTHNTAITGLLRVNQTDEALLVLKRMVKDGCIPNVVTCKVLVLGCLQSGCLDKALSTLREVLQFNLKHDMEAYSTVIGMLCKQRMFNHATDLLNAMRANNQKLSNHVLSTLMEELFSCGRAEDALRSLQVIVESGHILDMATYNVIVKWLCKGGLVMEAIELMQSMGMDGSHPNLMTYNHLMEGCFRTERCDLAVSAFRDLRRSGLKPGLVTYTTLIKGLCQGGEIQEAWKLIDSITATDCNARVRQALVNLIIGEESKRE